MAKPAPVLLRLPQIAAVTAIWAGCMVLLGWAFDLEVLKRLAPGLATMKANAAFAFVLSGASLWMLGRKDRGRPSRYAGIGCALAVFLIGFATLVEYSSGWNPGFDQLIFKDLGEGPAFAPGRPSPPTAAIFILVGSALPLLSNIRRRWLADTLLLLALEIALLAVFGYLYGAHSLYQIGPHYSVALHTAAVSVLLCLGCLFARPELGVAATVVSDSFGGMTARRVLPASIGIFALLGWFMLKGQHAGWYRSEAGAAMLTTANSTILAALMWWRTRKLSRIDEKRRLAEETLRQGFAELEDRVNVRTSELSKANAILSREIAERNEMESALRASQARFAGILDIAEDAVISLDQDQRIILFNQGAEKLFGYAGREVMGLAIDLLLPAAIRAQHRNWVAEFARSPQVTRRMAERTLVNGVRKDGREFPAEASISRLEQDGHQIFTVMLRDITQRKTAEDALQRSLSEKETLLREIHHRVKNNLQVVSSLMSLQAATIGSKTPLQVFQDSQGRVESMALIHEQLYKSEDLSSIDFGEYLKSLTTDLFVSYGIGRDRISLNIDVDNVSFDIEAAIPCALIVNELVTNSLKHAFPEGKAGTINVSLRSNDDRGYELSVGDDGAGLAGKPEFNRADSLGLRLVSNLARQLNGRIESRSDSGFQIKVIFPRLAADEGEANEGH